MLCASDGGDDKSDFGEDCVVSCSYDIIAEVTIEFCSSDEPTLASLASNG